MTFAEAAQQYRILKQQFDAGRMDEAAFEEAIRDLMIQDEQGRWWAMARDTGQWNYYDAATGNWVPAAPPTQTPPPPPEYMPGRGGEPTSSESASYAPTSYEPTSYEPKTIDPTYSASQSYQPLPAQPMAQPFSAADFRAGQPELSPGLKVVFYILSFLVPIVGIVLFFVYRGKPTVEDRSAARLFLILGLISFALSCFCSFVLPLMLLPFSS